MYLLHSTHNITFGQVNLSEIWGTQILWMPYTIKLNWWFHKLVYIHCSIHWDVFCRICFKTRYYIPLWEAWIMTGHIVGPRRYEGNTRLHSPREINPSPLYISKNVCYQLTFCLFWTSLVEVPCHAYLFCNSNDIIKMTVKKYKVQCILEIK